ncbi:hypothetical protein C8046_13320 [Serinibacter arcticus]|uniref:Uncharacterized protein n=2 Tax=Serinibacter arcticus TaxID=1655435 RepID=A0A2U1ZWX4_9MICO|nr:hypothetical protein C8046_13320 [Serinibacter arcticus]
MRREIEEEIPDVVSGEEFTISRVGAGVTAQVSRTTSALTQYDMEFFSVTFGARSPRLTQIDRWVKRQEMLNGRTRDGEAINVLGMARSQPDFDSFLNRLPYSFPTSLKPSRQLILRRIYESILLISGLAGIATVVSMLHGVLRG